MPAVRSLPAHLGLHPLLPLCIPLLQLLQQVLGYCSARELGMLEATCSYFIKSGLTDRIAKHFLKDIPRAKGLRPDIRQAGAGAAVRWRLQGCRLLPGTSLWHAAMQQSCWVLPGRTLCHAAMQLIGRRGCKRALL